MFTYMKFEEDGEALTDVEPDVNTLAKIKHTLRHFLHSKPVHIAVVVLVILDCILVLAEITLDLALDEKDEEKGKAPEILHYCSISILSVFMIEISLKLFADFEHFIHHKMEVFDAFIVVFSFAIDVAVLFLNENEALVAIGLFILLRLWRVVRIVNGIIVSAKANADERVHAVKNELTIVEDKVQELEKEIQQVKTENERFRNVILQHDPALLD